MWIPISRRMVAPSCFGPSGTAEGFITRVTGRGERLLARDGRNPRFSPDGGSVVYWIGDRDETVGSGRLYLLSLAEGSLVRLPQTSETLGSRYGAPMDDTFFSPAVAREISPCRLAQNGG